MFHRNAKTTLVVASWIIATSTLASRLIGLFRDRLFASHFGASATLDIYYAAFRLPDFIFNLLILGTLSAAFIPVFVSYRSRSETAADELANRVLSLACIGMSGLCLLLAVFAWPLTHILVPGFSGEKLSQTVTLTRILLFTPLLFTLSSLLGGVLQSYKRFIITSIAPILYNLGIIMGLVWGYPRFGITALAFGVLAGALIHALCHSIAVFWTGFRFHFTLSVHEAGVKKVITLFIPKIFGLDANQVSLLLGSVLGSLLPVGSIAIFNLASNLQAVPIGIFAVSFAVAAFPLLSDSFARKDYDQFLSTLVDTAVQILFFMIPITVLMLVLRVFIVRIALGAGQFSWHDTTITFQTLGIFTLSLCAQSLVPLLARAFYALQNTYIPVICGLVSLLLNAVSSFVLSRHYGILGVAAGFSIGSICNCLLLLIFLHKNLENLFGSKKALRFFDRTFEQAITKIAISALGMGVVTYGSLYALEPLLNTRTGLGIFIQAGVASSLGGIVFILLANMLRLPHIEPLLGKIKAIWVRFSP